MDLKELVISRTKDIDLVNRMNDVVKNYLIKNKLIIYGGQAIDYALRLKGKKLYEDYDMVDYDFYSYNNVVDAYEIFKEVINTKEVSTVSVLPGFHAETMRVRILYLYFIADSTYVNRRLYKINLLTALNYKGMYSRHPFLQMSDQCRALAYPFEKNGESATIIFRYNKDKDRFLLLGDNYKLEKQELKSFCDKIKYKYKTVKFKEGKKIKLEDNIYCGIVAYYIYKCVNKGIEIEEVIQSDELPAIFSDKPTGELIKHEGGMIKGTRKYKDIEYVIPGNKIGINKIGKYKVASLQFVIIYLYSTFINRYIKGDKNNIYLSMYLDLLKIMYENWTKEDCNPVFSPSIDMVGDKELSELELYLEEHPEEKDNVKPEALFYTEDTNTKELFEKIPKKYKYHGIYGFN